ncbi:outer membrane beta-barrel protein [candidate division GN15 bacterium]|nr:outer membrane beta-barrel protein [candidate division GN15 bacterium]
MKTISLMLGLLLIVGLNLTAVAQDDEVYYTEDEGEYLEVTLYGGGTVPTYQLDTWRDSLGAKTGWNFGFDVGYFLTFDLAIGLNFTYSQMGIDTDIEELSANQKHQMYNAMLYGKYYWFGEESDFAPYVKAMAGVWNLKFSTEVADLDGSNRRFRELSYSPAFAFGGGAGVFYYIHDFGGLFIEATYQHALTKNSEKDFFGQTYVFDNYSAVMTVHAGITTFFEL